MRAVRLHPQSRKLTLALTCRHRSCRRETRTLAVVVACRLCITIAVGRGRAAENRVWQPFWNRGGESGAFDVLDGGAHGKVHGLWASIHADAIDRAAKNGVVRIGHGVLGHLRVVEARHCVPCPQWNPLRTHAGRHSYGPVSRSATEGLRQREPDAGTDSPCGKH